MITDWYKENEGERNGEARERGGRAEGNVPWYNKDECVLMIKKNKEKKRDTQRDKNKQNNEGVKC